MNFLLHAENTHCLGFTSQTDSFMWLQSLLDRTWSWQLSCYCGRRPSNDGGGRRRGGQWFGWFASCRSGQLRLNGSNGLTKRDLESQTRWNGHSHVPAWQSMRLVSQTQTQKDLLQDKRQKDGRIGKMTIRDVLFFCSMLILVFTLSFFKTLYGLFPPPLRILSQPETFSLIDIQHIRWLSFFPVLYVLRA